MSTAIAGNKYTLASLIAQLPPFSAVTTRLITLVSTPEVSFDQVANLVRTDAAITARILRLANSPLYGRLQVNSVLRAISLLGQDRLSALIMTIGMQQLVSRKPAGEYQRFCWRHSLATACAAELFAPHFGVKPDIAYTGGLLHNIGCLALARTGRYEDLLRSVNDIDQQLLAECEVFGFDHGTLGAGLARHWGLPSQLLPFISSHHSAESAQADPSVRLMQLADSVAHRIGFTILHPPAPVEYPDWLQNGFRDESVPDAILSRINTLERSLTIPI